ncbi:hypothetical protein FDA58_07520 [Clostridium botulinum]|nr:hypothetical protein [Clostridium botulinum]
MKFACHDYFMIRTPALPFKYLKAYKEQKEDIYEFIHSDQYLDNFFKKALLVSSKSIYSSYINKPSDKKKYENLKKSLLKYFIRSTTRSTPYGYFASVSMGSFSDETRIIKEKQIIDIKVDNSWINSVISILESDINILQKLNLKINKLCYKSGDRFKNPYFTNYGKADGDISRKENFIHENNIRYTPLIEFIKNSATEFILYSDLEKKIIDKYLGVPKELVDKTINELCKNEYLLTNLRIPAYCNDVLGHVINVLESINYKGKYIEQLKAIQYMMLEYKSHEDTKIIEKIYSLMGQIHKNKDYLALNTGNSMEEKFLCQKLKTKIENLADFLAEIPVEFDTLEKFRMKFTEKYGTNVEVPMFKIIDSNDFNGLSLINKENDVISQREEKIRKVFDEKIFQAILNGQGEANFTKDDFENVGKHDSEYWKTYDLNVMIMKQDKDYKLYLGPAKSSSKAGSMFQRFANCFNQNDFKKYNEIYRKQDFFSDEYLFVEVREMSISGQCNNVINNTKNYKYFLCFGNCEEKLEEIDLKDIYVGMTNNEKLYLKSKKYNKKIKIISDNVLNPNLNNEIIQLLKYISESTECFPEARVHILGNNKYKYCPRINIEGIIVSPKKWLLDKEDLKSNNYEEFSEKLKKSKNIYGINDIVYQCINDNRIIIDMNKDEYIDLLYSEYRKSKRLDFSEIEKELFTGAIIKDNNNNSYINEFVFSVTGRNIKRNIVNLPKNIALQEKNKKFLLCEDGWI